MGEAILFDRDLVVCDMEASSDTEIFERAAALLRERGLVKDSFFDAICEREQSYPTGVPVGEVNVAIPHVESSHVNASAVLAITLKELVPFSSMVDKEQKIGVGLVFILVLQNGKMHLTMLQNLMKIVQSPETISALRAEHDPARVYEMLRPYVLAE
ncbi:PTS sugar transporter subunit IIA [Feifania hominis]|uniref:PTS sugar transporter subunit IIA n=1 Tax=Feifania hominis TaxID=2763660 RepID=A0A926HU68_9FIRM|nr:PTS sugar transporter subunit IIA [Feifania hominis]MBC8536599.1 PTS sugar transporter subunit IIA [Feifania hominis]